jgi:predicted ATPase/DNA-binding CsgD family transcriptional regulator
MGSRARGPTGNLPRALSSFVGRQEQIADLAQTLSSAGLLTLVGVGGVGKTRLALALATAVRDNYAHGVWLVELAAVTDPTQVAAKVAGVLGVRERPGSNPLETLTLVLRHRQLLLVLDNCEHVLDSSAELVATLLQSCDNLTVLATSREPLGVPGEVTRTVLPLSVPGAGASFEQVVECDALQLFVERVRASDATFSLTPQNAVVAGRICRRLDGLPLAIELAAARTRTMRLNEIAERLDEALGLLTGGPRAAPRRHQTLRAAIDGSFDLLTEAEQKLLSRLAIFSGGFSVDSVRQVCCDAECPVEPIVDLLDRLASHSLLIADTRHEHSRFDMLETIRQYSLERLERAGEAFTMRERHRDWCLALVAGAPPEAFDPEQMARLEPEMDNLRSALRWTIETTQVSAAARLALGITNAWLMQGSFAEGRAALTAVLDLAPVGAVPTEFPHIAVWAGVLAANQGEYGEAERLTLRSRDLARASNNAYAELFADNQLGWLALVRGDVRRARKVLDRTFRAVSADSPLAQVIRLQLAGVCLEQGNRARALALLDAMREQVGSVSRILSGRALKVRALLAEQEGDFVEANRLLDQSIASERAIGDQPGLIESLTLRGIVSLACGARQVAADALAEALDIASLYGSNMRIALLLEALSAFVVNTQPAACVRLAAAAEQQRKSLGAAPVPTEQARAGRCLEIAKRRLGDRAYAEIWLDAQGLPLETSLREAYRWLRSTPTQGARSSGSAGSDTLSDRERAVAILVARGLTNRQIAEELIITRKTVETHVSHVLNKLGLVSRVQIATWGLRHGVATAGSRGSS